MSLSHRLFHKEFLQEKDEKKRKIGFILDSKSIHESYDFNAITIFHDILQSRYTKKKKKKERKKQKTSESFIVHKWFTYTCGTQTITHMNRIRSRAIVVVQEIHAVTCLHGNYSFLDFSSTFTDAHSHVDIICDEYVPSPVTSVEWAANQCFVPTQPDSNLYYTVAANRAHPALSAHWALAVVARIHTNDLNRSAWIHCMWLWPNGRPNILHHQIQDLAPYQPTDECDALHLWKWFEKKNEFNFKF